MALTAAQLEEQKRQAEELLFSGPETLGFAKGLFFGQFQAPLVFPYPQLRPEERPAVEEAVREVRLFCAEHIDPAAIDRGADIPADVIAGLGRLGVLGMTAPKEYGGRGFSQLGYCKIMEVIGGHDASVAVFVNAHQSIGIRALVLFGTDGQKRRWLPELTAGRQLAAFALTEPAAGSDAANVQTRATPGPDGRTYLLNGEKRYITNGGIAQVLTVMARTPAAGSKETKVTAFLVTPDMPGFEVVEARMPQVRHPRHRHRPAGLPRHAGAGRPRARPARQGAALGPDGPGLRPDHLRRQLHRRRQDVPARRRPPREGAGAVQAAAGRLRAGQEEDRFHVGPRLRDGGGGDAVRRVHRPRRRRLHA
jgi:hypothetical protein